MIDRYINASQTPHGAGDSAYMRTMSGHFNLMYRNYTDAIIQYTKALSITTKKKQQGDPNLYLFLGMIGARSIMFPLYV
jgi:hypothetical protein